MQKFMRKLLPFIGFGIVLVLLLVGVILLSYLLVYGALIGLVLFTVAWLRDKFFPSKKIATRVKPGRTIDHDDLK